ncbi:MAG TPA: flotillin-like FloA family protein, partial [Cyclobacteriaceae bacterium]|nr:flotillin-like FloA family protein [Cyclobacteriaceae bacterium]
AEAFTKGNLGVMDYYKMQNVQADTEMRNSISGKGSTKKE